MTSKYTEDDNLIIIELSNYIIYVNEAKDGYIVFNKKTNILELETPRLLEALGYLMQSLSALRQLSDMFEDEKPEVEIAH